MLRASQKSANFSPSLKGDNPFDENSLIYLFDSPGVLKLWPLLHVNRTSIDEITDMILCKKN